MTVRRATCSPRQLEDAVAGQPLADEVVHYFTTVLRLGAGDRVEIADGEGRVLVGFLERGQNVWTLANPTVVEQLQIQAPAKITLLVGLLKPQRWRIVIEKSAELGVSNVVPVLTERTVIRPRSDKADDLLSRWKRIAAEAASQCRRPLSPKVSPPVLLVQALKELTQPNRLVATLDPEGIDGLETVHRKEPTALLVGPEGGLTRDEANLAVENGFNKVYLGPHTLRAETAAIVLVTLARQQTRAIQIESGNCS